MSQPERIFLGWEKPLARSVAEVLLRERGGQRGFIDLGCDMVIVPSAFAGRLVEEELARQAGSLLLPHIVTPQLFIGWKNKGEGSGVASREAMMMAWLEVLSEIDRADFKALFGNDASGALHTIEDRQRMAKTLFSLRDQLGESSEGHDFAMTAKLPGNEEVERWDNLAMLEKSYREKLADKGLVDRNESRVEQSVANGSAGLFQALKRGGIARIWVTYLTSPQPIVVKALENLLKQGMSIQVLVAAEVAPGKEFSEAFDAWGRPKADHWKQVRRAEWADFRNQVHVTRTEEDALLRVRELLEAHHTKTIDKKPVLATAGRVSIVPCDRQQHPKMLARALLQCVPQPAATANPLGKPHREHAIHHAMLAWLKLAETPCFGNLRTVLHIPDCAANLLQGYGSLAILNSQLDRLAENVPPQDLRACLDMAKADKEGKLDLVAKAIDATLRELESDGSPRAIGMRLLALSCPLADRLKEQEAEMADDVISAITEALQNTGDAAGLGISAFAVIRLALESAGEDSYRRNLDTDAVNLPGWQDAAWDPVPHLIVFGLNDHLVPDTFHSHPFLPRQLRERLGLPSNDALFAAAAHHFELLRNQRERLDVILPQFSDEHEGLRPSRLLYLCPIGDVGGDPKRDPNAGRDTLLGPTGRLQHLFPASDEPAADPAWFVPEALKLDPSAWPDRSKALGKLSETLSPSAIHQYLTSPADFWLVQVLGLREKEFEAAEMGAADFGTLVHDTLCDFAEVAKDDDTLMTCSDADRIRGVVVGLLADKFKRTFGESPSAMLKLQFMMAKARLGEFAQRQASDAQAGWRIVATERELLVPIPDSNLKLKLRFDRLDRNDSNQAPRWRVLDYKTKPSEDSAKDSHIKLLRGENPLHNIARFDAEGKTYRWVDLQLPLYHWAILNSGEFKDIQSDQLEIAYWLMSPRGECKVEPWKDFSTDGGKGGFAIHVEPTLVRIAKAIQSIPDKSVGDGAELGFGKNPYSPLGTFGGRSPGDILDVKQLGKTRQ